MDPQVKKIIYPIELNSISTRIAPWVKTVARQFGSRLHVIHVVPDLEFWGVAYASEHLLGQDNQGLVDKAQERAEKFCAENFHPELETEVKVVAGNPAQKIIEYAEEIEADMIIVGSHGRKGLDKALFGSVADRVLRISPVPVLVINPSHLKD